MPDVRKLAVVLAICLFTTACGERDEPATAKRPVVVPRLVGEQLEGVERRLAVDAFEVQTRERFSARAEGTVLVQRPRPGARVRRGSRVELSVSKGSAPGPYGELRTRGVGRLEIGAPTGRVLETFGPPDRRAERNLGLGPAPEVDWTWRLRSGDEFALHFDARRRRLTGYCTDSPRFLTGDGLRVGQVSVGMLARRYGDRVVPARIGNDTYLLSAGRAGTYPALAFTFSERSVLLAICGGDFPPAGD